MIDINCIHISPYVFKDLAPWLNKQKQSISSYNDATYYSLKLGN